MSETAGAMALEAADSFGEGDPWTEHTLEELLRELRDQPPFVVPGLLARGTNLYYGKPKAGKSAVVVNLCHAVITGTPFLGRFDLLDAHGRPIFERVVVLAADAGVRGEYADRLRALGVTQASSWRLRRLHRPLQATEWRRLRQQVRPDVRTLVILDSLTLAGEDDLANEVSSKTVLQGMGQMAEAGATTIVVAHQSDWGGNTAMRPQGHTVISAAVRWLVHVAKPSQHNDTTLTLTAYGNSDRQHEFTLARGSSAADLTVTDEQSPDALRERATKRTRERQEGKKSRNQDIAEAVVRDCQGKNQKQVSQYVHENFGVKLTTAETHLSKGQQYGALLIREGTTWRYRTS